MVLSDIHTYNIIKNNSTYSDIIVYAKVCTIRWSTIYGAINTLRK